MLLPGSVPEDFDHEQRVWQLPEPWRHRLTAASYAPRSTSSGSAGADYARRAALLVGDAAHTMPPFMGQGLCSGIRDAAALAWRLDPIPRGLAVTAVGPTLRSAAENEWIVNLSTRWDARPAYWDAQAAAERGAALRAADAPPGMTLPGLAGGLRAADAPLAGARAVQGTVRLGDRSGRFNDLVEGGFVVLARRGWRCPPSTRGSWNGSEHSSSCSRTSTTSTDG